MMMWKPLVFALLLTVPQVGACDDDLVIIVSPEVRITSISSTYLANLFLNWPAAWPSGKPAAPFDLAGDSPLKKTFYLQHLDIPVGQVRAWRARQIFSGAGIPPVEVDSVSEMLKRVATTPGAIGYVPHDSVNKSVRVLIVVP